MNDAFDLVVTVCDSTARMSHLVGRAHLASDPAKATGTDEEVLVVFRAGATICWKKSPTCCATTRQVD
jgi:hypothetical protein